jgi:hypothetical protein
LRSIVIWIHVVKIFAGLNAIEQPRINNGNFGVNPKNPSKENRPLWHVLGESV